MAPRFDAQESLALLWKRALATRTLEEHRQRSGTNELPKVLGALDLVFVGIGSIVGAGVFVLSGVAANELAGPAVVLSYVVAGTAALLSALCYAEMAVAIPVAGGAVNYVFVTFGELAAWTVAWNMCLEITLSAAAVARGFASYLATLLGLPPSALRISAGPVELDPAAVLLIAALTAILAKGTRESSVFNIVVSALNLVSIVFVLCAGFPQASFSNLTAHGFAPYGATGVLSGAAVVFFAFIGFDYVANAAEEAKEPARDLPVGIIGSLGAATLLYVLMSLCIVTMVPYYAINVDAPFSAAFLDHGMPWAARLVSLGAVLGITTSVMTGLLGQSRLLVVLGRERLLPARLAAIHERTGTPVQALLLTGGTAAALAFVLDIGVLAELVSIGTLYVFLTVCAGVLFMRFHQRGSGSSPLPVLAAICGLVATALGYSLCFTFSAPWAATATFLALFCAVAASLLLLPVRHTPARFQVPLFPFTPALGVLFTCYLICSLGWPAYVRFGAWMAAGLATYALYGVHGAEARELEHNRAVQERHARLAGNGAAGGGELASPHALGSLGQEGYAGHVGGVELEAGPGLYGEAQAQAQAVRRQQQQRLLAGTVRSDAYDPGED